MVSGAFNNYQKLPFKIAKIKSSLWPRLSVPQLLTVFPPLVPEKENKSQKK